MPGSIPVIYPKALESRLSRISFADRGTRDSELDFRELYYILQTDEGKYAFRSHAHRMERASVSKSESSAGRTQTFIPFPDSKEENPLECETLYPVSSLVLKRGAEHPSRIIAIANAGHGKTTLLLRLALYYCRYGHHDTLDNEVRDAYALPENLPLIPCIIRLRNYSERLSEIYEKAELCDVFIEDAINAAIKSELEIYEREYLTKCDGSCKAYLSQSEVRSNLLLLIDGLDELSSKGRSAILDCLEKYLGRYPETRVVLTSRVAGLFDKGILASLGALSFRGRSIMPLTSAGAKEYAELWINKTNEPSRAQDMLRLLDKVMVLGRYRYMREMMHAPLDLMVMLMSMSNGTVAPNRFRMFTDILRSRFTSHEKDNTLREPVFADTMMILGLCAYRMQKRNVLSLTERDIEENARILSNYSYQSNIIGKGDYKDYLDFFDRLSANSGIIEKETVSTSSGTETRYTIPIRSYHECLTAYAICTLRFSDSMPRPNPAGILIKHCEDKSWSSITNFAIAYLSSLDGESEDLKRLLEHIFRTSKDAEQLRGIIESDPELSDETARLLFVKDFDKKRLGKLQRELVSVCMMQSHYYSYETALFSLYRFSEGERYLEAYAYAAVLSRLTNQKPIIEDIMKKLGGKSDKNVMSGAAMVCELARLAHSRPPSRRKIDSEGEIREDSELLELCRTAGNVLVPDRALAELLYQKAVTEKKLVYFEALAKLFTVSPDWADVIELYINEELLTEALEILDNMLPSLISAFTDGCTKDEYTDAIELIYVFGVIGTVYGYGDLLKSLPNPSRICAIKAITDAISDSFASEMRLDRMSLAYARLLFGGSYEEFMESFTSDIYHCLIEEGKDGNGTERAVRFIKNPDCSAQERRFCDCLRDTVAPIAVEYVISKITSYNINPDIDAERYIERYFFDSAIEKLGFFPSDGLDET